MREEAEQNRSDEEIELECSCRGSEVGNGSFKLSEVEAKDPGSCIFHIKPMMDMDFP